MTVATSLIPGLDEIVRGDDPKRRAEAARQISELFLQGAAKFRPDHVDFFDSVLINLVHQSELGLRAELAERLSLLANAPRGLVGRLAREDELSVAGPLLRRSPVIDEKLLIEIAGLKGRGDRDTVRRAAQNAGAQFSQIGYSALIRRAGQDGVLTLAVGQRADLSDRHLKDLLAGSIDIIRRRLFEVVKPDRQSAIKLAMSEISGVPERIVSRRDFAPAQRTILALHRSGQLNEAALLDFAKSYKYEETVAALSALSAVKIATLDRLLMGDRHDPVMVLGKVLGLEWATVRALILLRLGANRVPSPTDIEIARSNFARLMPSSAERVVNFWKGRQGA
jgi:uncharacterized protein (DUF2336 family)